MVDESYFDDLDRSFLKGSSWMADVFSWTYGMGYRLIAPWDSNKFDNSTSKAKEIGIRILIVVGAIVGFCFGGTPFFVAAVILSAGSKIFRCVGFALQKNGFTHIRGNAPEAAIQKDQINVMTWNIRGYGGGLHYDHAGVVHWRSRVDRIVDSIKTENPDVIVLQEVYDVGLVEALVDQLKDQYAHFYTHLGANTLGNVGGCMVITKCAVHNFTHTNYENNDWRNTRGFETLEIKANPDDLLPCVRIIGTQLSPGKEGKQKRVEQIAQIVHALAKEKLALPTLFVGNVNEEGGLLSDYLYHSYLDKEPTHSVELVKQWAPIFEGQEESSDFISLFKRKVAEGTLPVIENNIRLIDCHLVKAFDENYDTKTALSDHHGVDTNISGLIPVGH